MIAQADKDGNGFIDRYLNILTERTRKQYVQETGSYITMARFVYTSIIIRVTQAVLRKVNPIHEKNKW